MSTEKLESISRVKITRLSPILDPENLENSARNPKEHRALLQDAPRNLFRTVYWGTLRNCSFFPCLFASQQLQPIAIRLTRSLFCDRRRRCGSSRRDGLQIRGNSTKCPQLSNELVITEPPLSLRWKIVRRIKVLDIDNWKVEETSGRGSCPQATSSTWRRNNRGDGPVAQDITQRHLAVGNGTRRKRGSCNRFFVAGTLTAVKVVRRKIDTCEKINCKRRRMRQRRTIESPGSCRVRDLYSTRGRRSST